MTFKNGGAGWNFIRIRVLDIGYQHLLLTVSGWWIYQRGLQQSSVPPFLSAYCLLHQFREYTRNPLVTSNSGLLDL
jgi:hypothetical protein